MQAKGWPPRASADLAARNAAETAGRTMRVGINLLCATGFVEDRHRPLLALAKDAGFDGVEVPILEGEPAHYERLGAVLDGLGLGRTASSIVPSPDRNPVDADPAVRARAEAHLGLLIECAAALGAETLVGPLGAPLGHFTGTGPTEDEIARATEVHARVAERAQAAGVVIGFEPVNRFETYLVNTAAQGKALAERVGHSAFGVLYDTFHANIEERSQPDAIRALGPHIAELHVSENDRGIPGRGQIDFETVFRAVQATGFDGWCDVEAFGNALPEIAAATRIWRPVFPDVETLFRESAAFVRDGWARAAAGGAAA
jgi:D-psicose/D-tagatose/L-ribulose 3-epimerase